MAYYPVMVDVVLAALVAVSNIAGGAPSSEPSVVSLINEDQVPFCTAVAIADHVLVTTRACAADAVRVYFAGGKESVVVATRDFPNSNVDASLLAISPGDASFAWLPGAPSVEPGMIVRLVAYGYTNNPDDQALKREGTAGVHYVRNGIIGMSPQPTTVCNGDAGGAVFYNGRLQAIITTTGADCATQIEAAVIAPLPESLVSFIDETAAGTSDIGDTCFYAQQCVSGICFQDADGGFPYCSSDCATTSDCPDDMVCQLERCVYPTPTPGAVGSECATNLDCNTEVCARIEDVDSLMCTSWCSSGNDQCPHGFRCGEDVSGEPRCVPGDKQGCGCRSTPAGTSVLALLMFAVLALRRRSSRSLG